MSTSSPDLSRRGFRWALALLLTVPVAKAVLADSIDPDFFWHVRVADQLLSEGIGPVSEPFSYMSRPGTWSPFSWLGELAMKGTYDLAGLRGIVFVHAACSVIFFLFLARAALEATRQLAGEPRYGATLAMTALAMLFSLPFLSFRPVTLALALLSVMHWLLWRDRRVNDRAVWWLVPMTLVLTNLHLYVILWIAGLWARTSGMMLDRHCSISQANVKRMVGLTLACSLAALGTPMLPGCVRNALWFRGEDPMVLHKLVAEIAPFYSGVLGKCLLVAAIACAVQVARSWRRIGFENVLWFGAGYVFLFQMGRFATVFCVIALPIAAAALPALRDRVLARRPIVLGAMVLTLAIGVNIAVHFPRASTTMDQWLTRNGDADNLCYPTAAAQFVESNVPRQTGRLINELTWGGYLIWRLGDRYQVFMDGRTLVYPAQFWNDLYTRGDDAKRSLLRDQSADAAIVPTSKSYLLDTLKELGWTQAYADDRAIVLLPPVVATDAR